MPTAQLGGEGDGDAGPDEREARATPWVALRLKTLAYFNASLISISRLNTSLTSSDRSTPRCSALLEKYW